MDLESIMLSEINHTEKDKHHMISLIWESKNQMDKHNNRNKLIDTEDKQVVARGLRVEG